MKNEPLRDFPSPTQFQFFLSFQVSRFRRREVSGILFSSLEERETPSSSSKARGERRERERERDEKRERERERERERGAEDGSRRSGSRRSEAELVPPEHHP